MARKWICSGFVAAGLGLAGVSAHAATVTDAIVDISGTYAYKDKKYQFSGDFSGDLLNHPKKDRLYDVGITISMRGKTVLTNFVSAGKLADGPFSIRDALQGSISSSGISALLGGLDLTSRVNSKSTSAKGNFAANLSKGRSKALYVLCKSMFSNNAAKKCKGSKDFNITLAFSYDQPEVPLALGPESTVLESPVLLTQARVVEPAPVPLPAGLPLLGAGLAALAVLRRRRS